MNNPSAFPIVVDYGDGVKYQTGMSLRDYFAAQTMQGLFASGHYEGKVNITAMAESSYKMADAMLKAREQ